MNIVICGSRSWTDERPILRELMRCPHDATIITGGARGADVIAHEIAKSLGFKTLVMKAEWHRYGPRAGFIRNGEMVEIADEVIAFWDGQSRGTADTIKRARAALHVSNVRVVEVVS